MAHRIVPPEPTRLCGPPRRVPHQPVKLYYRYSSGKVWHYVTTTTTTDGDGRLSVKLTGTHRYYRLVYGGSTLCGGTTSGQIYFSS